MDTCKFELWQKIYFLLQDDIIESKVYEILNQDSVFWIRTELCGDWMEEKDVYPSVEALINSQDESIRNNLNMPVPE